MAKKQNNELDQESSDAAKKLMGDNTGAVATKTANKPSKSAKTESKSNKSIFDILFGTPKARLITFAIAFAVIGVGFVVASFASTSEKYFSPNAATSRQAMAAFLYRSAGSPAVENSKCAPGQQGPFPDVNSTNTFCKEIEWMGREGLTKAYSDGNFRPDNAVSREAAAVFLYRADGSPQTSNCDNNPFDDVSKSSLFCKEIKYSKNRGYISGQGGKYRPTEAATRQAVAAMLHNRAGKPDPTSFRLRFLDVEATHTFFKAIQWLGEQQISRGSDQVLVGPKNLDPKPEIQEADKPDDAPDSTNTSSKPSAVDPSKDALAGKTLCPGQGTTKDGPIGILQTRLRAMGYKNVATDGIYGAKTEGAMKSWRLFHHNTNTSPGCYHPGLHEKFVKVKASGWMIPANIYNFLVALGDHLANPPKPVIVDNRPPDVAPQDPAVPPVPPADEEVRYCFEYTFSRSDYQTWGVQLAQVGEWGLLRLTKADCINRQSITAGGHPRVRLAWGVSVGQPSPFPYPGGTAADVWYKYARQCKLHSSYPFATANLIYNELTSLEDCKQIAQDRLDANRSSVYEALWGNTPVVINR